MKTAIYIEDGAVQLVITPESEFEKNAISMFSGKELSAKLFSGSFYDCRGGWVRLKDFSPDSGLYPSRCDADDRSLILRVEG